MIRNRSILKKSTVILAFAVSAVLFLPEVAFGKGAVVGHVYGMTNVTDAQLNHLTHVMAVDLYVKEDGNMN